LVYPNERRVTQHGLISGAALRDGLFLNAAALFLTDVHSAHGVRNALQHPKIPSSLRLDFVWNGPCR
jgi:hypothetical protein